MNHRLPGFSAVGMLIVVAVSAACATSAESPLPASTSPASPVATAPLPSASATAGPTTFVPAASLPAGKWTEIHWTRLPSTAAQWAPPPESEGDDVTDVGWQVFGWSRGYVAFDTVRTGAASGSWTAVTNLAWSTDGLDWTSGGSLSLAGAWDEAIGQDGVTSVVEGPAGLLAVTNYGLFCSTVNTLAFPVAVSEDGRTWTPIAPKIGGKTMQTISIQAIDGGSAGYIAEGETGVFTSRDGVTWSGTSLPSSKFQGIGAFDAGTSFAQGFVVSGTARTGDGGCGGPSRINPRLWWSRDGRTWTQSALAGRPARGGTVEVCRLNDRVLIATDEAVDDVAWTSTDGRTWTRRASTIWCAAGMPGSELFTAGDQTLRVRVTDDRSSAVIATVADDLTETELTQTGAVPDWSMIGWLGPVVGPTGLIVADDSGSVYVGTPVAG
jgi:hypothetical protein